MASAASSDREAFRQAEAGVVGAKARRSSGWVSWTCTTSRARFHRWVEPRSDRCCAGWLATPRPAPRSSKSGAGTAQLALGIRERQRFDDVSLHCFDRWQARPWEIDKAADRGVPLAIEQDTLPQVRRVLAPFDVPVHFHKGDIRYAHWEGSPISVYVDAASKSPEIFYQALRTFGPAWIPGKTVVVLMDFYRWKKTGDAKDRCQAHFVDANQSCLELLADDGCARTSSVAMFRYVAPIDLVLSHRLQERWRLWQQLTHRTGLSSTLRAGHLRELWHFFRLQPHPLRYRQTDRETSQLQGQRRR